MARVIYGAIVTSIHGSIGGTTFQSNSYGSTIKNKPTMVKPKTQKQGQVKTILALVTKAWKSTTDTARSNWNTWASTNPQYAKNNPTSQLSGFACFTAWHCQRLRQAYDIDTSPNLTVPPTDVVTINLQRNGSAFEIDYSCSIGDQSWYIAFSLSSPLGDSQNFIGSKKRYITQEVTDTATIDVTDQYEAAFGTVPSIGDRVGVSYILFMEEGGQVNGAIEEILTVIDGS